MSDNLILRPLHAGDERAFRDAVDQWAKQPKAEDFQFVFHYEKGMNWGEYLQILHDESLGRNLLPNRVPCSFLGAFVNNRMVGRVSLRHELNDFLRRVGGHIGYGVLISERQKGYATEMLRQSLGYCGSLGIKQALVTCDDDNLGSIKTIEKNGGVLENIYQGPELGNKPKRRYWISVNS